MGHGVAEHPVAQVTGLDLSRLVDGEPRIGGELGARALLMLAGGPCAPHHVAARTGCEEDAAAAALNRLAVVGFARARPMMGTTFFAITVRGRGLVSRAG
jgi:hypothetical protein